MLKNMSLRFSSNGEKNDAYRHIISSCYQVKHVPEYYIAFRRGHILLSYLLIAGCDIRVQFSVRPSFRPSSTFVTINFSVPIIARCIKPCIVIVITSTIDPVPLTYISNSPPISKYVVSKFPWVGHQICYKILFRTCRESI